MANGWLSSGHQVSVGWLSDDCQVANGWLSALVDFRGGMDIRVAVRCLLGGCQMTVRWPMDGCRVAFRCLLGGCQVIVGLANGWSSGGHWVVVRW